jgi:hypothetical protein
MDSERLVAQLASFQATLSAVTRGIDAADARWRPAEGAWSILEIVAHIADEETLDFRTRTKLTLAGAGEAWPPSDPAGDVVNKDFNSRDLTAEVERFGSARQESLHWLASLDAPDWNLAYEHPALGALRAGDVLASWAAHDVLHLRGLTLRRFQLIERDSGSFDTAYAGRWPD